MAQNKLEQILFLFLYFWFLYTHVRARRVKDSPNTCSLPPPLLIIVADMYHLASASVSKWIS